MSVHRTHGFWHSGFLRAAGLAGLAALSVGWGPQESDAPTAARSVSSLRGPAASAGSVRLDGARHPFARPELDAGPLDPGTRLDNLSIIFKLSPAQKQDRDALLAAQLDPGSPSYRKWLTPEQYAARFGARPDDIARTRTWLAQQGLDVYATSRLGSRVTFGGTVAKVQSALQTEMRRYAIGGETHYAMRTAPAIPVELSDAVLTVHNAHDFYPRPMAHRVPIDPDYKGPHGEALGPGDWATIYDVTPLYTTGVRGTPIDGTGVTIGIVDINQIDQGDIDAFRTTFGLPASTVTQTLVPNTGAPLSGGGAGIEAFLDVEWAGGIAPGATVNYVYTGQNDGNVDDATYYLIEENLASIISESWGGCEEGLNSTDAETLEIYGSAANLEGITYLASSGDSGAAACAGFGFAGLYVSPPASYPGVTAVGGTEFPAPFNANGVATAYPTQEQVWDDPNGGAGGGGISIVFSRPAYQSAVPACAPVGSLPLPVTNMRQIPDIAVSAGGGGVPYFIECTISGQDCSGTAGTPKLFGVEGTSASSPSFSGVVALLEQVAGGRLGNINPLLYTLESTSPSAFHDITLGSNEVQCSPTTDVGCPSGGKYGYPATVGYDCGSGIGSIDAYNLASAWAPLTATSTTIAASPLSTTEGSDVTLTATVDVTGTNANALAGTVTFTFQSYAADGSPDLSWTLAETPISMGTAAGGSAAPAPMPIPPGLVNPGAQYVDVVAMYGGDGYHYSSVSPKVRIDFAPISLCLGPVSATAAQGGSVQYAAAGGIPPYRWFTSIDTTCQPNTTNCSTIDQTTGKFVAGPLAGYVTIVALDSQNAEALGDVKVGMPYTSPPWGDAGAANPSCVLPDAGPPMMDAGGSPDAGAADTGGAPDAGVALDSGSSVDSGGPPEDASGDAGSGSPTSKAGCACETTGHGGTPAGMLAGLALGLTLLVRRRRGT